MTGKADFVALFEMLVGERHQIAQHGFSLLVRQVMPSANSVARCLSVIVACGTAFAGTDLLRIAGAILLTGMAFFAAAAALTLVMVSR